MTADGQIQHTVDRGQPVAFPHGVVLRLELGPGAELRHRVDRFAMKSGWSGTCDRVNGKIAAAGPVEAARIIRHAVEHVVVSPGRKPVIAMAFRIAYGFAQLGSYNPHGADSFRTCVSKPRMKQDDWTTKAH